MEESVLDSDNSTAVKKRGDVLPVAGCGMRTLQDKASE